MDEPRFQLTRGDAVAWLRTLPSESIDLVVTDPPYESLEKHRAIGTTTRLKHSKASSNDWFAIFPNARFAELFAEVYRVLKKNTHFYLFCDPETMFVAKPLAEAAGFKFWKPLDLGQSSGSAWATTTARATSASCSSRRASGSSTTSASRTSSQRPRIIGGYPAEKPPQVSEVLIRQSTRAGRARDRSVHGLGIGGRRGDRRSAATSSATTCATRRSTSRGGACSRRRAQEPLRAAPGAATHRRSSACGM